MIRSMEVRRLNRQELQLDGVICAQNPALNPQYLTKAVERYLPECVPSFSTAHRVEIYDGDMQVFR